MNAAPMPVLTPEMEEAANRPAVRPPAAEHTGFLSALHHVRDAALGTAGKVPLPTLAPFVRAVRISGGEGTLGYRVRGEYLLPAVIASVGDLVVEEVPLAAKHALAPAHVLDALLALQPRHGKPTEALSDSQLVARLTADAIAQAQALRDHAYDGDDARLADPRNLAELEVHVREMLRTFRQSYLLPSQTGVAALSTGWTSQRPGAFRNLPTPLPRLELGALAGLSELEAEWLHQGETAKRFEAKLASERKAAERAEAAKAKQVERETVRTRTTPFDAGLIVARRAVGRTRAKQMSNPMFVGNIPPSVTDDGYELVMGPRAGWPVDIPIRSTVAENVNWLEPGQSESFEVLADDAPVDLTAAERERGGSAPGFVLSAILLAAKASVTSRTPFTPIDMRTAPGAVKKAVRALREHIVRARSILEGDGSSTTVGPTRGKRREVRRAGATPGETFARIALLQLGAVRLRLRAEIVSAEVHAALGEACWIDLPSLISTCARIQANPAEWIFEPLTDGGKP